MDAQQTQRILLALVTISANAEAAAASVAARPIAAFDYLAQIKHAADCVVAGLEPADPAHHT